MNDLCSFLCVLTNCNDDDDDELVNPVNAYIFSKRLNILGSLNV
jgi:hypothetical protein